MLMRRLRRFWTVVKAWLLRRPSPPYRPVEVGELPDELDARTLYLVGENGYRWFAAMLCPCGCGATLHLNLLSDTRPRWEMTEHRDGYRVAPPLSVAEEWIVAAISSWRRGDIEWSVESPRARG